MGMGGEDKKLSLEIFCVRVFSVLLFVALFVGGFVFVLVAGDGVT